MEPDMIDEFNESANVTPDIGPTFEDLAIDDTLTDIERISRYVGSNIALQRLVHVKMLADTARSIGYEKTCTEIIPLLDDLVCDVEFVVRQHVAAQFPSLSKVLVESGGNPGYKILLNKVLPLVAKLAGDDQPEVRTVAGDSLAAIAKLIQPEDKGQYVLTIILPFSHEDDNDELRIFAVTLFNQMADQLGPDLCHQFAAPELISLSEDPVFRVRKATALNFRNVCRVSGRQATEERLLPAFLKLSKDDVWGVRKACAESLVSMSESISIERRKDLLGKLFKDFSLDTSKWVRMAAYQSLGPFISTLSPNDVTDDLIRSFAKMATRDLQLHGHEADLKYHCAYNFPGVVQTLGKERWPALSATFADLYRDGSWKVRRTLAYSLHEMAKLLGQDISESELVAAFEYYLEDVDDVKMGCVQNIADFLEQLGDPCREMYLSMLKDFSSTAAGSNWRYREVVSKQLSHLCRLFSLSSTHTVLVPLFFELIHDDVAYVRDITCRSFPALALRLTENKEWMDELVKRVIDMGKSRYFKDRQLFIHICDELLHKNESEASIFKENFREVYISLASDNVSNVRLMLAQSIAKGPEWIIRVDGMGEAIQIFKEEKDADIIDCLKLLPIEVAGIILNIENPKE